ncbi:unnamed protein product [Amoebophrya sp. A120]|nr:unnamed protein product [Amoebophrya sp. A120]|eukprot:GSA120T00019400001.1
MCCLVFTVPWSIVRNGSFGSPATATQGPIYERFLAQAKRARFGSQQSAEKVAGFLSWRFSQLCLLPFFYLIRGIIDMTDVRLYDNFRDHVEETVPNNSTTMAQEVVAELAPFFRTLGLEDRLLDAVNVCNILLLLLCIVFNFGPEYFLKGGTAAVSEVGEKNHDSLRPSRRSDSAGNYRKTSRTPAEDVLEGSATSATEERVELLSEDMDGHRAAESILMRLRAGKETRQRPEVEFEGSGSRSALAVAEDNALVRGETQHSEGSAPEGIDVTAIVEGIIEDQDHGDDDRPLTEQDIMTILEQRLSAATQEPGGPEDARTSDGQSKKTAGEKQEEQDPTTAAGAVDSYLSMLIWLQRVGGCILILSFALSMSVPFVLYLLIPFRAWIDGTGLQKVFCVRGVAYVLTNVYPVDRQVNETLVLTANAFAYTRRTNSSIRDVQAACRAWCNTMSSAPENSGDSVVTNYRANDRCFGECLFAKSVIPEKNQVQQEILAKTSPGRGIKNDSNWTTMPSVDVSRKVPDLLFVTKDGGEVDPLAHVWFKDDQAHAAQQSGEYWWRAQMKHGNPKPEPKTPNTSSTAPFDLHYEEQDETEPSNSMISKNREFIAGQLRSARYDLLGSQDLDVEALLQKELEATNNGGDHPESERGKLDQNLTSSPPTSSATSLYTYNDVDPTVSLKADPARFFAVDQFCSHHGSAWKDQFDSFALPCAVGTADACDEVLGRKRPFVSDEETTSGGPSFISAEVEEDEEDAFDFPQSQSPFVGATPSTGSLEQDGKNYDYTRGSRSSGKIKSKSSWRTGMSVFLEHQTARQTREDKLHWDTDHILNAPPFAPAAANVENEITSSSLSKPVCLDYERKENDYGKKVQRAALAYMSTCLEEMYFYHTGRYCEIEPLRCDAEVRAELKKKVLETKAEKRATALTPPASVTKDLEAVPPAPEEIFSSSRILPRRGLLSGINGNDFIADDHAEPQLDHVIADGNKNNSTNRSEGKNNYSMQLHQNLSSIAPQGRPVRRDVMNAVNDLRLGPPVSHHDVHYYDLNREPIGQDGQVGVVQTSLEGSKVEEENDINVLSAWDSDLWEEQREERHTLVPTEEDVIWRVAMQSHIFPDWWQRPRWVQQQLYGEKTSFVGVRFHQRAKRAFRAAFRGYERNQDVSDEASTSASPSRRPRSGVAESGRERESGFVAAFLQKRRKGTRRALSSQRSGNKAGFLAFKTRGTTSRSHSFGNIHSGRASVVQTEKDDEQVDEAGRGTDNKNHTTRGSLSAPGGRQGQGRLDRRGMSSRNATGSGEQRSWSSRWHDARNRERHQGVLLTPAEATEAMEHASDFILRNQLKSAALESLAEIERQILIALSLTMGTMAFIALFPIVMALGTGLSQALSNQRAIFGEKSGQSAVWILLLVQMFSLPLFVTAMALIQQLFGGEKYFTLLLICVVIFVALPLFKVVRLSNEDTMVNSNAAKAIRVVEVLVKISLPIAAVFCLGMLVYNKFLEVFYWVELDYWTLATSLISLFCNFMARKMVTALVCTDLLVAAYCSIELWESNHFQDPMNAKIVQDMAVFMNVTQPQMENKTDAAQMMALGKQRMKGYGERLKIFLQKAKSGDTNDGSTDRSKLELVLKTGSTDVSSSSEMTRLLQPLSYKELLNRGREGTEENLYNRQRASSTFIRPIGASFSRERQEMLGGEEIVQTNAAEHVDGRPTVVPEEDDENVSNPLGGPRRSISM